ncbi:cyclic nucleotide-binding domain-containing protein [Chlamydiota bacterium]
MVSIKFLRTHTLFGGISDEKLKVARNFLVEKHFKEDQEIFQEGQSGDDLFLIYSGSVEILKSVPSSGGRIKERIAVLGEGHTFGEMELIDVQPRSATIRALEKTTVFSLSNRALYHIEQWDLETFTLIILNLAREISRRLRKMDALVASFVFSDIDKKDKSTTQLLSNSFTLNKK